jgi:hypothetical protein
MTPIAHQKPDLSGEWRLNRQAAAATSPLNAVLGRHET